MTIDLDDHQVEQRKATLVAKLEALGDVAITDTSRPRLRRLVEWRADAPGADLPALATFLYREAFQRTRKQWRLVAYAYEYLARARVGRRAYHWHDDSVHAHCVDSRGIGEGIHYRAVQLDVFEAHDEFARLYLGDQRVRCDDLRVELGESG